MTQRKIIFYMNDTSENHSLKNDTSENHCLNE